jgi:hypothetical protein
MEIYCLREFKKEYEKLCKKDSYSDLTTEIIDCFYGKKFSDYVALIKKESIYFGYVHPKTGSMGSSNTTDDFRRQLVKDILEAIQDDNLLRVDFGKKTIKFVDLR